MNTLVKRPVHQILDDLPELCLLKSLTDGETIAVRKGELGFWPMAGRDAAQFNTRQGITPAQVEAMRAGSMFGFDVPAADPQNNTDATDME
jgi:hypothetical protein